MGVLEDFSGWVVFEKLGFEAGGAAGEALNFFIYDTIKVFILLSAMVFLVSLIRASLSPHRIRQMLGGGREGAGNLMAALLGVPTPFCSCSAVPLFIGFVKAGVPLGITFSFLISSPMVDGVAIAMLLALFGWEVTLIYVSVGVAVATVAGIIIGRMGLEGEVEEFVKGAQAGNGEEEKTGWKEKIAFAKAETAAIVTRVGPYVLVGVGVGAYIHGFVPADFLAGIAGKENPLAVPVAVLVGIPLYSNAAGTIPIVQALMAKGMAMGTALALMMSITALSLPEMVILRRVLKPKLIAVFAGILAVSFVLVGLLFNAIIG